MRALLALRIIAVPTGAQRAPPRPSTSHMKRIIGEWIWRVAMICALGWVGLELHGLREDLMQPADDNPPVTAEADGENGGGCVDVVRQRVRASGQKIAAAHLASIASR